MLKKIKKRMNKKLFEPKVLEPEVMPDDGLKEVRKQHAKMLKELEKNLRLKLRYYDPIDV